MSKHIIYQSEILQQTMFDYERICYFLRQRNGMIIFHISQTARNHLNRVLEKMHVVIFWFFIAIGEWWNMFEEWVAIMMLCSLVIMLPHPEILGIQKKNPTL